MTSASANRGANAKPRQRAAVERRLRREAPSEFPFAVVSTPAADQLLSERVRAKVTVVVAPVGYGKTVLLTSLHQRFRNSGERCFWTSLDDRDTSVHRALSLLEVLSYRPGQQQHPTQALFRGDDPIETRVDMLIEAARRYPRPMTVFIDNLEFCADPEFGYVLDRLVFETPPSVRFVLASTSELPLNAGKAKLQGLLRQFGIRDLSLDTARVVALLGPDVVESIGRDGVKCVEKQSEGWPAAVRMLQILLSDSADPTSILSHFRGSDEDLSSFLQRQVLSQFSADIRNFLFDIAQLRTFCVELCQTVTENPDVSAHWDFLIRRNIFIIPIDRNRRWYRLHGLFRDFLITQSRQNKGERRNQAVLRRAASWCEHSGYWRDAIDYALEADANELAVEMLDRYAANFVRNLGDNHQYIAWAKSIIDRRHSLGWEAEYWYIWALVLHQRYDSGRKQMDAYAHQLEQALADTPDDDHLNDLNRRLEIIRVCVDTFTDHLGAAHQRAATWLEHSEADDPFDTVVANGAQSAFYSANYSFTEARESAMTAQSASFQSGSPYAKGWITIFNALPTIMEGNYALAYPELGKSLESLRSVLGDSVGVCGTIAFLATECALEMGRDQEAREHLHLALRTAQNHGLLDVMARGLAAALKLWSGSQADVIDVLQLREIAAGYPPRLSYMFSCGLIRRLLRLGELPQARDEALRCGLHADTLPQPTRWDKTPHCEDLHRATVIDLLVADGTAKHGDEMVREEFKRAREQGRALRVVELALTQMILALQEGRHDAAHRHLGLAFSHAASRHIVRPFLDHAQSVASIVEETRPSSWGFALDIERQFFKHVCGRLPVTNRRFQEKMEALDIDAHLLESLTPRQAELLQLIDAGLTNQQIADRLGLSIPTIKGHLFNLYAKLDVSTRSAAVAKARAMNLL